MLIDVRRLSGIYLICGKTDLRRGIDGLAGVIKEEYQRFILLYKRIEDGRLQWPTTQSEVKKLHAKQLERLLSGWGLESTVRPYCPQRQAPNSGKVSTK
ncbi:IS66 family insertion sequence element accessory protein TnpB [Lacticaseibacillus suibinensis]|uniref:IS66 family insertion sequence element accessory protein TnpB n=1 Tax=Lacticaseibacillus suibinensis TaxID=2486011 RepID=UPI0013DE1795|nr:IS66 family insertion sequence element accessory protein TnpB [Lacticaseibacillus suibinensis]